ncbi:hypothetical protein Acsp03_23670 [Actinomadura sp. NBRC 104412]|uniref:right-handed parallel beta-helix repeat-containing protein n=1 Tax=Actinomadura sp. NBRC 104412 TaxID=3032203 RepID=UPI0024A203BB|nr:right-handed parallel beta-helix repeat-containing protein [Actinomadura sp. NBRC 104412]GLZ04901.1 hypothetical protein Acsp03_23670 [Actinomadura sp. NBRC 104412]
MSPARRALVAGAPALIVTVAAALLVWRPLDGDPGEAGPPPGTATAAGAVTVGTAAYEVPEKATVVSPSGDDTAAGTMGAPLRTVGKAIALAPSGGTIVLRGGTYHESVTIPPGKRLTVQSHPGEAAWFDGSSPVDGWTRDGDAWVKDGWTARFDASPSYTRGAPPSDDPDFQFIDPAHPMAAHPDQVWIDDVAQRQVSSRDEVTAGAFYVDERAGRLYLGSDPRGRTVRASTLGIAITIGGDGSALRGVGVRRYAPSLPQLASVRVTGSGVSVENVAVTDSATTGLSVVGPHARVRRVTLTRNGMLGVHGNQADDLRLERVRSTRNNLERFKQAPVSGGVKVTRSRGVTVTGSVLSGNLGKGLWLDESVHGITVTGNRVARNAGHGIVLELSAEAVVAGNLVRDNGGDGLRVNDTEGVQIWNNTLVTNGRAVHLVQDERRPEAPGARGRDPRRPFPDPTMTWRLGRITLGNNVLADARPGAPCLLCVEDHTHDRSAAAMGITADGDVFVRPGPGSPRRLIVWSRGAGAPDAYTGLAAFRDATGQERAGIAEDDPAAAGADGALSPAVAARAASAARPLPARVAALLGRPAGARHTGAWPMASD